MVDYEKGVPAWDISQILTTHASRAHGDESNCQRVQSLLDTKGQPGRVRLDAAAKTPCTCGSEGRGGIAHERTTYKKEHRLREEAARANQAPAG